MASASISGGSGSKSGGLNTGESDSTEFAFSTGWGNIPLGSKITGFTANYDASISGTGGGGGYFASAYAYWPAEDTDDAWGNDSADASAVSPTPSVDVIFDGNNPGSTGAANVYNGDGFYTASYTLTCNTTATVTFDTPSAKNLFFGTVG
jgi:hypothetical protein